MKQYTGFSLLEVLIALAIFSMAALAALSFSSRAAVQLSILEEKTLALWVAENMLEEMRMQRSRPPTNHQALWIKNGDRHWQIDIEEHETPRAGFRRIKVEVRQAEGTVPAATLTGYRGEH